MPTRISGACNGCRSKKQKCSGDKSGCAQCEAAGIPCTWPEQRKRGPAKGYIEGLEHRLYEAESLLLQVLPFVSTEQLEYATSMLVHEDAEDSGRASPDRRSSPPVLNKKSGLDYWEQFPLTNVTDVRRWQRDCQLHSSDLQPSKTEVRPRSPSLRPSSAAAPERRKRHSIPREHQTKSASTSHKRNPTTSNEDIFARGDLSNSVQTMQAQTSQMPVDRDQRQRYSSWQTVSQSSMPTGSSNPTVQQQQLFSHAGYTTPGQNAWPQQQANRGTSISTSPGQSQGNLGAPTDQAHSHLFW